MRDLVWLYPWLRLSQQWSHLEEFFRIDLFADLRQVLVLVDLRMIVKVLLTTLFIHYNIIKEIKDSHL